MGFLGVTTGCDDWETPDLILGQRRRGRKLPWAKELPRLVDVHRKTGNWRA